MYQKFLVQTLKQESRRRKFKILDNKNWVQQYLYQKFMAYILAHFKL